MQKILSTLLVLLTLLFVNRAWAGGAPASTSAFDWEKSSIKEVASEFVMHVGQEQFQQAYESGSPDLQQLRSISEFFLRI